MTVAQFEQKLGRIKKTAMPYAVSQTLTETAFKAREQGQKNIRDQMILRNRWTERSVFVEKARPKKMMAATGTPLDYLEDQELGATETATGRLGVAIPTPMASDETSLPRRAAVRPRHRVGRIELGKRRRLSKMSPKQRFVTAAMMAARHKEKYFLMDGDQAGLYRVKVMKRRRRKPVKVETQKIHDLSRRQITIPKNPWLRPAAVKAAKTMSKTYKRNLIKQIRRWR